MDDENDFTEVSIISNTAMNSRRKLSPLEIVRLKAILKQGLTTKDRSSDDGSEENDESNEGSEEQELTEDEQQLRSFNTVPERRLFPHSIPEIPGILNFIKLEPQTLVPTEQANKLSKSELTALSEYKAWTEIASVHEETRYVRLQIEASVGDNGYFMATVRNSMLPPFAIVPEEHNEPEAAQSEAEDISPLIEAYKFIKQVGFFRCSLTGRYVYVYYDEEKDLHHLQRGNKLILLLKDKYQRFYFQQPATSYSGNWYLVGYPEETPQEQYLFVLDPKTLQSRGRYRIDKISGCSSDIHFLKPHKELYPFLINTSKDLFLLVEFQHRLYPIASLRNSQENPMPKIGCLVHLADRAWLCLESLKKAHVLVVDSTKLYQFLQVN